MPDGHDRAPAMPTPTQATRTSPIRAGTAEDGTRDAGGDEIRTCGGGPAQLVELGAQPVEQAPASGHLGLELDDAAAPVLAAVALELLARAREVVLQVLDPTAERVALVSVVHRRLPSRAGPHATTTCVTRRPRPRPGTAGATHRPWAARDGAVAVDGDLPACQGAAFFRSSAASASRMARWRSSFVSGSSALVSVSRRASRCAVSSASRAASGSAVESKEHAVEGTSRTMAPCRSRSVLASPCSACSSRRVRAGSCPHRPPPTPQAVAVAQVDPAATRRDRRRRRRRSRARPGHRRRPLVGQARRARHHRRVRRLPVPVLRAGRGDARRAPARATGPTGCASCGRTTRCPSTPTRGPPRVAAMMLFERAGNDGLLGGARRLLRRAGTTSTSSPPRRRPARGSRRATCRHLRRGATPRRRSRPTWARQVASGAPGTPAFFINGVFLSGAQPYEKFAAIIDEQLAEGGRS